MTEPAGAHMRPAVLADPSVSDRALAAHVLKCARRMEVLASAAPMTDVNAVAFENLSAEFRAAFKALIERGSAVALLLSAAAEHVREVPAA